MSYTLYMHTCPNGKRYIGITSKYPIEKRFKQGSGYKHNIHFYRAIQKYGWENIKHEVLSNWLSKEEAEEQEKKWIANFKTNNSKYGYNLTSGGEIGKKQNESSKEKLKQTLKESYRNNSRKGKKIIPILQFDINGNLIKEYDCINSARVEYGEGVWKCVAGKRTSFKSFYFQKKSLGNICLFGKKRTNLKKKNKTILQKDFNGLVIKKWNSVKEIKDSIFTEKRYELIYRVLVKKRKTAYGYIWEYAEEQT